MEQRKEIILTVQGMTCGGCETSVRRAVAALPGVEEVLADHHLGRVIVRGGGGGEALVSEAVVARIEAAGFDVLRP